MRPLLFAPLLALAANVAWAASAASAAAAACEKSGCLTVDCTSAGVLKLVRAYCSPADCVANADCAGAARPTCVTKLAGLDVVNVSTVRWLQFRCQSCGAASTFGPGCKSCSATKCTGCDAGWLLKGSVRAAPWHWCEKPSAAVCGARRVRFCATAAACVAKGACSSSCPGAAGLGGGDVLVGDQCAGWCWKLNNAYSDVVCDVASKAQKCDKASIEECARECELAGGSGAKSCKMLTYDYAAKASYLVQSCGAADWRAASGKPVDGKLAQTWTYDARCSAKRATGTACGSSAQCIPHVSGGVSNAMGCNGGKCWPAPPPTPKPPAPGPGVTVWTAGDEELCQNGRPPPCTDGCQARFIIWFDACNFGIGFGVFVLLLCGWSCFWVHCADKKNSRGRGGRFDNAAVAPEDMSDAGALHSQEQKLLATPPRTREAAEVEMVDLSKSDRGPVSPYSAPPEPAVVVEQPSRPQPAPVFNPSPVPQGTSAASGIAEILAKCGLESHAPTFEAEGITVDILKELDDSMLKELGLNLGERVRLKKSL